MRRHKAQMWYLRKVRAYLRLRRGKEEEWTQEGLREALGGKIGYEDTLAYGPSGITLIWNCHIAQVETLLKNQDLSDPTEPPNAMPNVPSSSIPNVQVMALTGESPGYMPQLGTNNPLTDLQLGAIGDTLGIAPEEDFSWELISLGLEEPLPGRDFIDEMYTSSVQFATSGN